MTPTVERAGPAAAALLAELHGRIFPRGWSADEFRELVNMPGAAAYVIVEQAPAGLAVLRRAVDEVELLTIGVLPSCRGRGIARYLLVRAAADLEDVGRMVLEVATDNKPALALYRRLGFREVGRRKGYYATASGAHQDALVMAARLPFSCRSDDRPLYTEMD